MDTYAIIENGQVINLIEYETEPSSPPPGFEGDVIAVLANGASIGWTYNNGVLTAPQPFPNWTLVNNVWTAPVSMPTTGGPYVWSQSQNNWVVPTL